MNFHCRVLLELSFRGAYDRLVECLFIDISHMIYEIDPPWTIDQVKESLHDITYWFVAHEGTYIRCFRCHISPNIMLWYVTNKVILQELAKYLDKGLLGVVHRRMEVSWPTFPLRIGFYELKIHGVTNA